MLRFNALQSFLQDVKAASFRFGRIPLALLAVWLWAVWWGEHRTFESHVQECIWSNWETWVWHAESTDRRELTV